VSFTPIALIDLSADNLSKERNLHAFVSKNAHIKGSRVVKLISHAVWTIKVSLKHPQFKRIGIHFFQEIFDIAFWKLPAPHKLVIVAYV
jgi:hypothetical protein